MRPLKLQDHCEFCKKKVKTANVRVVKGKRLCSNCYLKEVTPMPSLPQLFNEPITKNLNFCVGLTETQYALLGRRLKFLFPLKKLKKCAYLRSLVLADLAYWEKESDKVEKEAQLGGKGEPNYKTTNGLEFKRTSIMCPEQYDVFRNGVQVAYIRLRWGHLTVEYPDDGGNSIFERKFKNDMQGTFPVGKREKWLEVISQKIVEYIQEQEGE